MILGFLIQLIGNFVNFLLGLLPASNGLPTPIHDAILSVAGYLHAFSFLFPVDDLLICALLAIGFEVGVFGFKSVNWILGKLRGSN